MANVPIDELIGGSAPKSTNISIDDEVLKIFAKMSDALKVEVLHYAEYLLNKGMEKSSGVAIASDDIPKKI